MTDSSYSGAELAARPPHQETIESTFLEPLVGSSTESARKALSQPTRLRYCGILKQLYEVLPDSGPRCPLCGYLEGDL